MDSVTSFLDILDGKYMIHNKSYGKIMIRFLMNDGRRFLSYCRRCLFSLFCLAGVCQEGV
jgi:hypothetical protein